MIVSQPLLDYTPLIRALLGRDDITGTLNADLLIYGPCDTVAVGFLPWENKTLYPPVRRGNKSMFMNPYTRMLYETSPMGPSGLYVLINTGEGAYLGCIASNQTPTKVRAPRNTLQLNEAVGNEDVLRHLRTAVHYRDPKMGSGMAGSRAKKWLSSLVGV
ncbi:unnamed protein product [Lota lota]